jgi:hypothetical protein
MRTIVARRMLLAGASTLAMMAGTAGAGTTLTGGTYIVPSTGIYEVIAVGSSGIAEPGFGNFGGGGGATVGGDVYLSAGEQLLVFVGAWGAFSGDCLTGCGWPGGGASARSLTARSVFRC